MPAPKKPAKIDPHDPEALRQRIAELTAKLRQQRKAETKARAVLRAIQARKAKLAAWRRRRSAQLAALAGGPRQVIDHALKYVGQTESPAGSNRGPGIVSLCQKELIGYDGVAWCGCFGAYFLRHFGRVAVTTRMAYCPFNVEDARKAQSTGKPVNGWRGERRPLEGRPGDCAMMDWQKDGVADHFVVIVENLGGGKYRTVEGNTSFDNAGSQSNGGCVAEKIRFASDMQAICIPAYA